MAFSSGVFSRLYTWVTDKNNSVPITASRMDAEFDGMATGLSQCLLKDGTQTVTSNIPMATYKFTGLGSGSARTDSINLGAVQDGTILYGGVTTGTDTIIATLSPAITAYVGGMKIICKKSAAANATTTPTLNVNSVGAKTLTTTDGTALAVGDLPADCMFMVIYDSVTTTFKVLGILSPATAGSLINGATAKTTPTGNDMLGLMDSAASNVMKKLSWTNMLANIPRMNKVTITTNTTTYSTTASTTGTALECTALRVTPTLTSSNNHVLLTLNANLLCGNANTACAVYIARGTVVDTNKLVTCTNAFWAQAGNSSGNISIQVLDTAPGSTTPTYSVWLYVNNAVGTAYLSYASTPSTLSAMEMTP